MKQVMIGQGQRGPRRLVSLIAVGTLVSLLLVACGGGGASPEEEAHLKKEGAEHVHKEERLRRLEKELRHIKKGGGSSGSAPPRNESSPPSTPSTSVRESCGGELEVNSYTTCPFAENVEQAYFEEVGSGSGDVEAWSPKTEKVYVMYCTGSPHECTGGTNAAVYFP